jgi:two-component system, OmpR family, response regulator
MSTILVVDDDPNIRELVGIFLTDAGYRVLTAKDGEAALSLLASNKADLVILDIMMPVMDGWELARRLRNTRDLPILMLTAKSETSQKVRGFELGADDYLTKPFEPAELVARVKALLKRYGIERSQTVIVGGLYMNRKTFETKIDEAPLTLPLKEFELLFKLASYPGRTFSREQLIAGIWGEDFEGNERTLDVHINRLRDRFPDGKYAFKITTIRGLGYRLETTE